MITNSHFEHNPNADYIKYAQAFWMLKCIQDFYEENELNQNDVPLIVTGDLNSVPHGSSMHLIMGYKYDPNYESISNDPKFQDAFLEIYKKS